MTTKPSDPVAHAEELIRLMGLGGRGAFNGTADSMIKPMRALIAECNRHRRVSELVLEHADMWTNPAVVRAAEHATRKGQT